ncbi:hypothetical protein [Kitasatospora sp. NPDC093806]|uniref:hypothetical protein n=1 Tax=Kitasatospora sp. NPDC093806 TaxID=3155075 RepID=UPI003446FA1D
MPGLQQAVLLRAAAAALVLGAALGAQGAVVPALAKRGVERAERDAYVCAEAARMEAAVRATRADPRRDLSGDRYEGWFDGRFDGSRYDRERPPGCDPAPH